MKTWLQFKEIFMLFDITSEEKEFLDLVNHASKELETQAYIVGGYVR